jgi:iron(III) transport system permease protein
VAYLVARTRLHGRGLLDVILWVPSIIPGILAGLGLLWMFLGTPMFRPLYGTIFLLVVAMTFSAATLGTQIMKAAFLQLGRDIEAAGRMSGATWWTTYVRIVLPLVAANVVLIGVLQFLFAAQNASTVILLATSDTRPLSLLTLDYSASGLREQATVNAVIITLLTTGVALVARAFGLRLGLR